MDRDGAHVQGAIKVLAFAGARDVVGADAIDVPIDGMCSAAGLLAAIIDRWPDLAPYRRSLRLAINGTYASPGDAVRAGDEVALIPPVAGG